MFELLSLLSRGGSDGGGGVIGLFISAGLWSTELVFMSVVDSSSTGSRLMLTSTVDGPLQLFGHSFECSISSKAVFGKGGTPSCVVKRKWILWLEGAA